MLLPPQLLPPSTVRENGAGASPAGVPEEAPQTSRLAEVAATLHTLLSLPATAGIPLLILANKQDRPGSVDVLGLKEGLVRPVFEGKLEIDNSSSSGDGGGGGGGGRGGGRDGDGGRDGGDRRSEMRDSRVLPVSALAGTGVREAVGWLRTRCEWGKEVRPGVMR